MRRAWRTPSCTERRRTAEIERCSRRCGRSHVGDPDFELYVTQDMVDAAHERGIRVIPWTVDDPDTMRALMDLGVDGLITDYPDRVRAVMSERGLPLPEPAR
ncbi:hypothetical protein CH272_17905 [Rhodococcus sp. 05-340-1]|nr:hypothetical protein CH271_23515 [Rhodococcus sp. 05-340-2]OZD75616.1 hypothetical protein CH272_17905 [Rhodococcus sp. 05-340-1]